MNTKVVIIKNSLLNYLENDIIDLYSNHKKINKFTFYVNQIRVSDADNTTRSFVFICCP